MIDEKIVSILNQLEELAKQYSPEVLDSAINVVRMNGVSMILEGFICGLTTIAVFFVARYLVKLSIDKEKGDYSGNDVWGVIKILSFLLGIIFCLVFFVAFIVNVFDVWSWVAIFDPKLALAKKVLML